MVVLAAFVKQGNSFLRATARRSRIPALRHALTEPRLDARRDRRAGCSFREPAKAPPGFGLRQSSGAFRSGLVGAKAAEDCRSPRRYRGGAPTSPIHAPNPCTVTKRDFP